MNKLNINVIALAVSLVFSTGAIAHNMSKNDYPLRIAKAEADYAVAKGRCDDLAGDAKDRCVNDAKSAETAEKANAKAHLNTPDAHVTASQNPAAAHGELNNPAQACATTMQAHFAAFRANFLLRANSAPHP